MITNLGKLSGTTLFITGASRGIGKAIALKAARDGANIVVAAKTVEPHAKLPGTIFTAAKEIEDAGGKALPCVVDVRNESSVEDAVAKAVNAFGGIDIVVNNASAISLTGTQETIMKKYDLMHQVNTRGTYLVSKACIPHLLKSKNAHILNISPPLNMSPRWFKDHAAYTMAKYGMSMCVLGMAEEFRTKGIAVNALWPKTAILTAAMEMLGGTEVGSQCRKPEIMADAAYAMLCRNPKTFTGNFIVDEDILKQEGVTNLDQYAVQPGSSLLPDFFLDEFDEAMHKQVLESGAGEKKPDVGGGGSPIDQLFVNISTNLNPEVVEKTKAMFVFDVTGKEEGKWFLNLKEGSGSCGKGDGPLEPDVTFTLASNNLIKMFSGGLKPTTAFMTGKLKIAGDMGKAMKLEKLMGQFKAKL